MFVNTSLFKTMTKEAFARGGLSVARIRQRYVIAGNWWCLRVRGDAFPAKAKAAVIELVSEFPQIGEKYTAYKSEDKQRETFNTRWSKWLEERNQVDAPTKANWETEPKPTGVYVQGSDTNYRIWQTEDKKVLFVPAKVDGLVSNTHIDRRMETDVDMPICLYPENKHSDVLYWKNNCCELWVACAKEIMSRESTEGDYQLKVLESIQWPCAMQIEI